VRSSYGIQLKAVKPETKPTAGAAARGAEAVDRYGGTVLPHVGRRFVVVFNVYGERTDEQSFYYHSAIT